MKSNSTFYEVFYTKFFRWYNEKELGGIRSDRLTVLLDDTQQLVVVGWLYAAYMQGVEDGSTGPG